MREIQNQENMRRKNCCVTSMVLFLMFKMLLKYTGKTEITQGNHMEISGNFAFQDEWEP